MSLIYLLFRLEHELLESGFVLLFTSPSSAIYSIQPVETNRGTNITGCPNNQKRKIKMRDYLLNSYKTIMMKPLGFITIFLFSTHASALSATDYGFADSSIGQLSEFNYYRGKWESTMEQKLKDDTFRKLKFKASIRAEFLEDGKTFQTQFKGSNGFFSTDIRTYNIKAERWDALFLNAKAQRWHKFTAKRINGKMTTIVIGGYSGNEEFDVKTVDKVISKNQYIKNVFHSFDKMKTWKQVYKITVKKLPLTNN